MSQDNFNDVAFGNNVTEPDYNARATYINPNDENDYLFVSNMYKGEGGVKTGSYLVPFSRELWYAKRKQMAAYRNFIRPIVNSIVEPVYAKPIVRDTNNDTFEAFLLDVDNRGTPINPSSMDIMLLSRLHGVTFVVMDNFPEDMIPEIRSMAIDTRTFPYIYVQPAFTVHSIKTDIFGNIISITFLAGEEMIGDKLTTKYITWDNTVQVRQWLVIKDKKVDVVKEEIIEHNLGVVPVIPVYSTLSNEPLPTSPFYDLAKLNWSLFNKDSELRDQERAQAFSVFYAQLDSNDNNQTIGPRNMLLLPINPDITITPGYASPDSSILTTLMQSSEAYVDSIFKSAQQQGVTAVRETSGIAESYKFNAQNNQLKKTSKIAEDYEKKLSNLFGLYIGEVVDYVVSYSKDYDSFYSSMSIQDAKSLLESDLPEAVKVEIRKSLTVKILDHLDTDKLDALIDTAFTEGEA